MRFVEEHTCVGAEVKVGGVGAGDAVALPLLVGGRGGGRLAEVHRPPGGDRQLPLLTILPLLLMLPGRSNHVRCRLFIRCLTADPKCQHPSGWQQRSLQSLSSQNRQLGNHAGRMLSLSLFKIYSHFPARSDNYYSKWCHRPSQVFTRILSPVCMGSRSVMPSRSARLGVLNILNNRRCATN